MFAIDGIIELSDFIGNPGALISIESGIGATYSLTTLANQKVLVFAIIDTDFSTNATTVNLDYDGVTKDTIDFRGGSGTRHSITLAYEEVPGAGTANITVDAGIRTPTKIRIFVVKLLIGT